MPDLFGATEPPPAAPSGGAKLWCPAFLVDEITPEPRARPENWLSESPETVTAEPMRRWRVGADGDGTHRALGLGDEIDFMTFQAYGEVEFVIRADGSFTASSPIPPNANCFHEVGDIDTFMETAEGFAREYAANAFIYSSDDDAETLTVDVFVYRWSAPIHLRLTLAADGTPIFEES